MSMKGKTKIGNLGVGIIITVVVVAGLGLTGVLDFSQFGLPTTGAAVQPGAGTVVTGGGSGFATSVSASGLDPLLGSLGNINVELWETRSSGDEQQVVAETQANAALASLSTNLPNTFNGFIMAGNDDLTSGTDRGTEYYYSRNPVSWVDRPGLITFDRLNTYAEGTLTETGYDDGTIESTVNITVGAGGRVTTTELRIETAADTVFGNPQVPRPIAVCFNETTAGMFSEIKPKQFESTMAVPGFLSAFSYITPCYVLPIDALQEGVAGEQSTYRFGIDIEADGTQNPVNADNSHALFLDATYYQNDNLDWVVGFEDVTDLGTDTDVGSDNLADNFIVINYQ